MTAGQVERAVREAYNQFDTWNDATGCFEPHKGYYCEMQGLLEEAVHVGIQMALEGKITKNPDGSIKRPITKFTGQ